MCIRPRMEKNALQTPRTGRFPDFEYCQVVDRQSLKITEYTCFSLLWSARKLQYKIK